MLVKTQYLGMGGIGFNEPLHSVWAYNIETKASVLITVYRPDPEKWIDWKIRRKP